MRSPLPHDANDTDAATLIGELVAWQQHNAGALFPHPHGELLVAPLNPSSNQNPIPDTFAYLGTDCSMDRSNEPSANRKHLIRVMHLIMMISYIPLII